MDIRNLYFRHVGLSSDKRVIFCELTNGRVYTLPLDALADDEQWDGTPPVSVDTLDAGHAALVRLRSGRSIGFPVDYVLHECEPAYAYFRGKKRAKSKVGARIRRLREAQGLTLDQLAERTRIAKPNLSRLEHDKVAPGLETLRRVAGGLDTTVKHLLTGKAARQLAHK